MDNPGYRNDPQDEKEERPPSYYPGSKGDITTCNNNLKSNGAYKEDRPLPEQGTRAQDSEEVVPGRCGIFCLKPEWMQRFGSKRWFIAVFLLAITVKGMSGSYIPSTITSVQKRLKISTETMGYVMSGNEISQILFALILSYVGGKGHRPRWMAFGVLASGISYFLYATPHILYGAGNEALSYTEEHYNQFYNTSNFTINELVTTSNKNLSEELKAGDVCKSISETSAKELDCGSGDKSVIPMTLIFMSQFVAGIGSVLLYTLAGPFIDDHMKPTKAPIMIAVTGAVRQTGPLVGYFAAYVCLRLYVVPTLTPLINNKDERWLGAWWLGCIFFSAAMFLSAMLMVLFPRVLRTSEKSKMANVEMRQVNSVREISQPSGQSSRTEPIFKQDGKDMDFWTSLKDIIRNKPNLWNNISLLFYGFAFSGFATYFPKYLETVIKQDAANAALAAGLSSIFFQISGLLLSGFLISKFMFRARTLAGVNIFVSFLVVLTLLYFPNLVCKQGEVVDTTFVPTTSLEAGQKFDNISLCSSNCNCATQITPVCHDEKKLMYLSACHAGCKSYNAATETYSNCSCLPSPDISLSSGKCVDQKSCYSTFLIFLGLMAAVRFGSSFGRIGNVLIPYRCVDRSQKSLTSGLSFVMYSLVSIPSPIIYGKIIDSTCIKWGTKCGNRGSCQLYDDVKYAYAMSVTAAVLCFVGLLCDVMVWYHVKDLKLYGEEEEEAVAAGPEDLSAEKSKQNEK